MMKTSLDFASIDDFRVDFESSEKHRIAMNAVTKNGIKACCYNRHTDIENTYNFSISIEAGEITNQKKSGRCWMFAALNVMRLEVMKKLDLKNMELSQAYPLFWDKLEKSNFLLENILSTSDEPVNGRVISHLLKDPLGDGGQWDMFVSLVKKYGVVPKEAMPESKSSSDTAELDELLTTKLRGFALELRNAIHEGKEIEELLGMKKTMMNTIYRMLSISLGEPPRSFSYETRDRNDQFIRISDIAPVDFFKIYVGMDLDEYVSIINAPTDDKPYDRTFTVQYLGNVVGGNPILYLNLPSSKLKELAIRQMKDGEVVWFGCHVDKWASRETGVMAMDSHDYCGLFSTEFPMTKAQRLDFGESLMTHAMVLTGVNLDGQGNADRWRVENSWGEDRGCKGFFVMGDDWFDEYTYQVVINKKYLSESQLAMLDVEPIILKPWDPMGSLA